MGSQLNGAALDTCPVNDAVSWTVPYAFTPRPAALAKTNALAKAGAGKITVRRASDNVIVDQIDISNAPSATDTQTAIPRTNLEIDALGLGAMPDNAARARFVWYRPITVSGNAARIKLRSNKLAFDTTYVVRLSAARPLRRPRRST